MDPDEDSWSSKQQRAKRFLSKDAALLEYLKWKEAFGASVGEGKVIRLVRVIK
jgi:hypothetical protein